MLLQSTEQYGGNGMFLYVHLSPLSILSTIQQDLKQHLLTLPEAADLAQNRPMWRMMSTYGATQS